MAAAKTNPTSTKRSRSETVGTKKGKGKATISNDQEVESDEPPKKKVALKSALKKSSSTSNPTSSPLTSNKPLKDHNPKSKSKSTLKSNTISNASTTAAQDSDSEQEGPSDSELIKGLSDISDNEIGDSDDDDGGADSSDDDDDEEEEESRKVGKHSEILTQKLPNSKDDKAVKARLDKLKSIKSKKGLVSIDEDGDGEREKRMWTGKDYREKKKKDTGKPILGRNAATLSIKL